MRKQVQSMMPASQEESMKRNGKEHELFLAHMHPTHPQLDKKNLVTLKAVRTVPSSSVALVGSVDQSGLSEDARAWLRESEHTENADKMFFSTKVKTSQRLWNDPAVPDSAFAADSKVHDHRQKAAERPLISKGLPMPRWQ